MDWLGSKLGYVTKSDWYNLKISDLSNNYGEKILLKYNNSPSRVVTNVYSDQDWKGWLFSEASNLFWKDEKNMSDCILKLIYFYFYLDNLYKIRYGMARTENPI